MEILSKIEGLEIWAWCGHDDYDTMVRWCEENGRPVPSAVAFARNPWDWYTSVWSWLGRNRLWFRPLKDYIGIVYENEQPDDKLFRSFSWHWRDMRADKAQYIGQMENLRRDAIRILVDIMPDLVTAERIGHIVEDIGMAFRDLHPTSDKDPKLWRVRGPYRQYYDDEAMDWVREMDKELIERFGYEF